MPGRQRIIDETFLDLEEEPSPFYIAASGSPSRTQRALKHNDCFAVLDNHGDIGFRAGGSDGLFAFDTRHLSRLVLLIDRSEPLLLGSNIRDDNLSLHVDLTNPDILSGDIIDLLKDTVHLSRSIYLHGGVLRESCAVTNYGSAPVQFEIKIVFDSDFADLFEVRGMRRPARGRIEKKVIGRDAVHISYTGLDEQVRDTTLTFEPAPKKLTTTAATFSVDLPPLGCWKQFLSVACALDAKKNPVAFFPGLIQARRDLVAGGETMPAIETSNTVINEIICRSLSDLRMLTTRTPDGKYPYAGIPWYSTTFGRDALITAMQMLWFDPALAKGVLRRLGRLQADRVDLASDAQPGKILHEMRSGEMAALGEVPFGLYYGSIDSTPLFVLLAGLYFQHTGDRAFLLELWPHIERALAWIEEWGDADGDGFVEYSRATEQGLVNQGWKDSHDAIFHAGGELAEGPIALVEVQGYVYAAYLAAADCAEHLGHASLAARLRAKAEDLRLRFEEAFWSEELGTYALALDGMKRRCEVRTSNAGQALFTGIVSPERARRVAADLRRPAFQSGWGIRTVAVGEARYNPLSYHNGSIWPHDNALIAAGLARYGLTEGIAPIFDGLMQAAAYMDQRRLPELYCGFPRRRSRGPTLYPVACSPQAWASGAVFHLLRVALGFECNPVEKIITLRNPAVPLSAGTITIRNFCLGNAMTSFSVCPHPNGTVSLNVLERKGNIEIRVALDAPLAARS
jgi:glycogen debranching enzyme